MGIRNVFIMDKRASVSICIFIAILAIACFFIFHSNNEICWEDFIENTTHCIPICPNSSFALPGMLTCHPWLSCSDNISVKQMIDYSVVKKVYLAEWKGHQVVMSQLTSSLYENDFKENLKFLLSLGPNSFTVQFIGYCNNTVITRYYKLGNALSLNYHLSHHLNQFNTIAIRFRLCISYVAILNFLHTSPVGVRVMCDSNTLEKTLSQYLFTDNFQLIVNDLDAVPEVNTVDKKGVICGKKQLYGCFVAPEQLWPFEGNFSFEQMPAYNEKTDIWKIPDVCNWFLGNSTNADILKFRLFTLHKTCKNKDPTKRPSAKLIIDVYQNVWDEFSTNT